MQNAPIKTLAIPDSFEAVENKFRHKMKLMHEDHQFGAVIRKNVNGTVSYEFMDNDRNVVAIAHKKFFDYGSLIEIYDMFGGFMGSIEHLVKNPMSQPIEKYIIFDGFGRMMAETKQQNDIDKSLTLFDTKNKRALELRRKNRIVKQNWEIMLDGRIDKRLLVFLPSFVDSERGKEMV